MILKASQRGGAKALGQHLINAENEHVEVHEIRGFVSDNLMGAMKESQAIAKGTRCKQHLFSVSLSPPETATVDVKAFETAIERIEKANGLTGQPRIIVFHEKEGRRHAHAVWSRIDADTMTARQLSHFKRKLGDISKGLYLEHGWSLPKGFINSREHDPRNFSLGEWQQAKRMGKDPRTLKSAIQECWASTDNREAFTKSLEGRGLYLAKGDRNGHVAITYEGEVLSIPRILGLKTKDVRTKLGKADDLQNVEETKSRIAQTIAPRLEALLKIAETARVREMEPLEQRRQTITQRHSAERQIMADGQRRRSDTEAVQRAEKFRSGVSGLWDRLTGKHSAIRQENEREAFNAYQRDRTQRGALVASQLTERRDLQREIVAVRQRHASRVLSLHRDIAQQRNAPEINRNQAMRRSGPGLGL
jgi:hypothetical protein